MRKHWILASILLVGAAALVTAQVVIMQRPLSNLGLSTGVGYGTTEPTVTNSFSGPIDGELFVVRAAGTSDPDLKIYSQVSGAWTTALVTGGTDAVALSTDITLGNNDVDDITVNGPITFNVFREDFDFVTALPLEEDFTAPVLTDAGQNMILLLGSQIRVIAWQTESSDGLSAAPDPWSVRGSMALDTMSDDVDNDGIGMVFGSGGPDDVNAQHTGVWFDEDDNELAYCEVEISIADISDTDDLWFGWIVKEAYDNPGASDTYDTSALFVISDLAGDLDIETELNAGGTLNDDTAETWADNETHIMRVTLGPDSVSFALNGTAVTQTNAVLNLDATDEAVCVLGYTLVATSDPTVVINYVELGLSQ